MAFADDMVEKYQALLLANAGVKSVNVDGQSLSLDDLEKKLEYWSRKVARADGTRPRVMQINLESV